MKRHFLQKILFITVLGLALLSSCNPSDQAAYLVVIPVRFNLPPVSAERTFMVKTTENWYMEQVGNEDWCTVYPDKGTPGDTKITLNVTSLPDEKPRIAIYIIKSTSGIEKTLTVEQSNTQADAYYLDFFGDPDPMINVDPFDVEPVRKLVFTNVPDWKVTVSAGAENWLSAIRDKDTLLITISDIDRPEGRIGTVTASGGGSVSTTLTISQKGLHEFLAPTRNFHCPFLVFRTRSWPSEMSIPGPGARYSLYGHRGVRTVTIFYPRSRSCIQNLRIMVSRSTV